MFNRRLTVLMILWTLPVLAVTFRLVQLQVLHAEDYRKQAQRMLYERPEFFPFLRGEITDRNGNCLAKDVPSWNICVQYDVIARDIPDDEAAVQPGTAARGLNPCWQAIAEASGVPIDELLERAGRIKQQVTRIKEDHAAAKGFEELVEEENMAHPVVSGLSHDQQVEASLRLGAYPAIKIRASHVRAYSGGEPVGHLLGQMVEVDGETIRNDPRGGDGLARYTPGDVHGVTGAEALGESVLRGRRGRVHEDLTGRPISPPVEPVNGQTFRLTIDYALQEAFYNRLGEAVKDTAFRTGGCAVLIHIPTRQILAMVDYPSMDPAASREQRAELLKDRARQPWLFRAVREYYPPGSTVKPMLLAAAMAEGLVSSTTEFNCIGRLLVDEPKKWRCTALYGHGLIAPVAALQHSCNVYFFHVGEKLGVAREAEWMDRFGLGRRTGVGLPGELPGRLPRPPGTKGAAWNTGIGQGDFLVTPLQAANMIATVAAGEYRPVTLRLDDPEPRPADKLPIGGDVWRLVHEGMYKVVNEQGGTAFGDARGSLSDPQYVLLGKTGSAEVEAGRPVEFVYVCHLPDGRVQEIVAPDLEAARAKTDCPPVDRAKVKVVGTPRSARQYPPANPDRYTHAWFVGYLAPRGNYLLPVRTGEASVAIAVVIEFTGHGGDIAAPVARDMLRTFLQRMRGQAESVPAGGAP